MVNTLDVLLATFRLDEGTTANEPACGAYEAVMAVLLDDTFVVMDGELVLIDWRTAVELTAIEPPDTRLIPLTTFTTDRTNERINMISQKYPRRLGLPFPADTIGNGSLEMPCCCGSTLATGKTVVVLFEFVDVTIFTPLRTICDKFVATEAGNVVTDVPLSEVCVARDVIVNGTTVEVCCVP